MHATPVANSLQAPVASVVIPTLGAAEYLDVTLASVIPQAMALGAEVIVVSDGPDPATEEVARRHEARLVVLPERRGVNGARNAGIDAARSELIVFTDADIEAAAGWLSAILEGSRRYPEHDVFGGPIRPRLENGLRGCGREPAPITALDAGPEDRDVALVWGANMAIRRRAFERVGRFDDALSGRGDEEEWELRLTASGGRIRYLAGAALDHRRTAGDSQLSALARSAYRQGREAARHSTSIGRRPTAAGQLRVIAGCAWHTVRRRCPFGVVMGARAAGTLRELIRH
jgi:glycosyltransferase involved in cell wall biosynthesis